MTGNDLKHNVMKALGRRLEKREESLLNWVGGWDPDTIMGLSNLFSAMWKAGQKDGMSVPLAKLLEEQGIDFRTLDENDPKVLEIASKYGVEDVLRT